MSSSSSLVFGGRRVISNYFHFLPIHIPDGAKVVVWNLSIEETLRWIQSAGISSSRMESSIERKILSAVASTESVLLTRLQESLRYEFPFMSLPPEECGLRLQMRISDQWLFIREEFSVLKFVRMDVIPNEGFKADRLSRRNSKVLGFQSLTDR